MLTPEQQETIARNRALIEECQKKYGLPPNPHIDEELLLYEFFPDNDEGALQVLVLAYKLKLDIQKIVIMSLFGGYVGLVDRGFTFLLHNKDKELSVIHFDKEKATIEEKDDLGNKFAALDSFEIQNFFCIKSINIDNLSKHKEIYFLGENGDGKTLLLQSLVLAMKTKFRNKTLPALMPDIETLSDIEHTPASPRMYSALEERLAKPVFKASPTQDKELKNRYAFNVFAYGVHRSRRSTKEPDEYGFGTLFRDDVYLRSPEEWLLETERLNLKGITSIKLETAIEMLEALLDNNVKITIEREVIFKERGFKIAFSQLSEGYKSVITWVVDMLSRLAESQPEAKQLEDFRGIVLVDEISLHLHPNWEFKIVRKLRDLFRNIQFIFTTHSPVNVMGASEDAVFFRLYKDEDGYTQVSEPFYASDMSRLMANSIITSPLFDMETAHMRVYDEKQDLDTSDDYLYARIHKAIAEDVAEMRKAGKKFISTQKLDEMIKKMLEKY